MEWLIGIDWAATFAPETPLLEIFLRGSLTYLGLFFLLRLTMKRQSGTMAMTDLLVIVLLADAAQNAMSDDYRSITDGLLLVGTIIFWSYALDWLGYRFPFLERWVHPSALLLVENGRMIRPNLERELITEEELMDHLRQQGVEDLAQVKAARIEGSGSISVIKRDGSGGRRQQRRPGM